MTPPLGGRQAGAVGALAAAGSGRGLLRLPAAASAAALGAAVPVWCW